MFNDIMDDFYKICTFVLKLVYINTLWLVFTLLGIVIFGIFPSTVAVYHVMREIVKEKKTLPIFKTFWKYYKKEFVKANILGAIILVINAVLVVDILFVSQTSHSILHLAYYPLLFLFILFNLGVLYVFPVYVHYDVHVFKIVTNSIMLMIIHPLRTIMMGLSVVAVYLIFRSFPGMIPILTISLLAFVLMRLTYQTFVSIDEKQFTMKSGA